MSREAASGDPAIVTRLVEAARRAQEHAHAPYSRFCVGAALLTSDGQIFVGCNVENASYPLSVCAERNAIAQMVVVGASDPVLCVVVGPIPSPVPPCGACRQVLAEFNPRMEVICVGTGGAVQRFGLDELLPHQFHFTPPEKDG